MFNSLSSLIILLSVFVPLWFLQNTKREDLEKAQEPVEFPEGEIPLTNGQPGTSQQVAQLVLFLVSHASSHITGTEVWIDGGQSLLQG